jgi:branched-chain amino acid aminotransferase
MVRAAPGGLGSAKTGANYVASLYAAEQAKKVGCDQVLWLDAVEHKYVEETGASNVFWLDGKTLCTTSIGDTVLAGITRDSLLALAPKLGFAVKEMRITIDDLASHIRSGRVTEMFGSGTAAVVSPISELLLDGEIVRVADGKPGPVSKQLLDAVVNIHRGRAEDSFGWCRSVPRPSWL